MREITIPFKLDSVNDIGMKFIFSSRAPLVYERVDLLKHLFINIGCKKVFRPLMWDDISKITSPTFNGWE